MNNSEKQKLPKLFWIVAIAAVIWNVFGVTAYLMEVTMDEQAMATLPEAQQAIYAAQPAWVIGAFAIAVFTGLAGSIALALRKGLATSIFIVSLVAVVAQMSYMFAIANIIEVMGAGSAIMPILIIVIAVALVWFSTSSRRKGWIG
jgi:hypothetical protein